jgi:putative salt-induced outer membrane protein
MRLTMPPRATLVAFLSLAAAPALAPAQIVPTVQQAEQQKEKPKLLTGDLGYVKTSGNTDLSTLSINEKLAFAKASWGFEQSFGTIYGTDEGDVTTSLWRAGVKGERFLNAKLSAVLGVAWDKNRFAGIDGRFEEFVGLKYRWVESQTNRFYTELAASLVQQDNVDGTSDEFPAGRVGAGYRRTFSERAYFEDTFDWIPNLEDSNDYRINNEAAIVAPLTSFVALKFSYIVRFDNLPAPGFEKTDTFFTSGIQVAF